MFDPLHFVLPSSPSVDLQVQHSNHLSAPALYSQPLAFQHIISLVRSKSACYTLAPNSWMCLGENSHTDCLTSWRPSAWLQAHISPVSSHSPNLRPVSQADNLSSYFSEEIETFRRELPHDPGPESTRPGISTIFTAFPLWCREANLSPARPCLSTGIPSLLTGSKRGLLKLSPISPI